MTRYEVGSRPGAALAWSALVVVVAARVYRAMLLTLVVAALVPAAWGWHDYLVRTGSMRPSLAVGDVVVGSPLPTTAQVPVGRVMVFTSPATGRTTVHRVVGKATGGRFRTAGDANPGLDPTPVARTAFHEQGRLRVPLVGLPVMWLSGGHFLSLLSWLVLTAAAFVIAGRGGRPRARSNDSTPSRGDPPEAEDAPEGSDPAGTAPTPADPLRTPARGRWPRRLVASLVIVPATIIAVAGPAGAAAFTATTRNSGSNWGAAPLLQQPYTKEVLADQPYFLYRVDEAGGTVAADSSGNSRAGTFSAVGAYRQAGALPGNYGYSVGLKANSGRIVGGGAALSNPSTFSLELWFKTSSTSGGKLIGFDSSTGTSSLLYDRHVFLRTDGRLVYGGWLGGTTATTASAYNDNSWHHLVLSATQRNASRQDFVMYVDGTAVSSGTTAISSYTGYWQIGYGPLPFGIGYPDGNFTGAIDNVAVYQSALSATRVAAHYGSR